MNTRPYVNPIKELEAVARDMDAGADYAAIADDIRAIRNLEGSLTWNLYQRFIKISRYSKSLKDSQGFYDDGLVKLLFALREALEFEGMNLD